MLAATMAPEAPAKSKSKDTEKKESSRSEREVQDDGDADLWEIRILDNDHHFDYQVAEILVKVANLSELVAFKAMRTAEKNGSCSIGEYDYEMAEHYLNALQDHYLGCEMNPLE
jgi:ATP-dependent Clp protease adapter protein ClpS